MADVLPLNPAPPQAMAAGPPEKAAAPAPAPALAPAAGVPVPAPAAPAAAVLGQPVDEAHRPLPIIPKADSLPSELHEFANVLENNVKKEARNNGKDFRKWGKDEGRPKLGVTHVQHLNTLGPNVQKLKAVGYERDIEKEFKDAGCERMLQPHTKYQTTPEPVGKPIADEVKKHKINGKNIMGDNWTTREVRQAMQNLGMIMPALVGQTEEKNAYDAVIAGINSEKECISELEQSVADIDRQKEALKRQMEQLDAEKVRKMQIVTSKTARVEDVQQKADDLLHKSEELSGIRKVRAQKMIIGANCDASSGARDGILEPTGLTLSSHYKAVEFDKVLDGVVHTVIGHCMVKWELSFNHVFEWGDKMPAAKKQKLIEKLSN